MTTKRPRMLLPVILAALASSTQAASAENLPVEPASDDVTLAREGALAATYGDVLTDMARASARRAVTNQGADQTMEAISELAVRWLEMPEGATRVWEQHPRNTSSVKTALRNAQRSLWRKEHRHERIATALASDRRITEASQPHAVELGRVLANMDTGERELLLHSAQGMTSAEIARELDISAAAVRQRLARARRLLS